MDYFNLIFLGGFVLVAERMIEGAAAELQKADPQALARIRTSARTRAGDVDWLRRHHWVGSHRLHHC